MKIKVANQINLDSDIVEELLKSRDLDKDWLTAGSENFHDGSTLHNYSRGKALIKKHLENNSKIAILVDSDADGMTSAAIIYQWLKIKKPEIEIVPIVPEGKVHGIAHTDMVPECDLLITPDGSSSDGPKHKILDCDILVLDHHQITDYDTPAVVINPHHKDCSYPNKSLSGAGVVYKFIEAMDKEVGSKDYEQFIDLTAVSTVADVMSLKEKENKAIVNTGLANIKNGFFQAFLNYDFRVKGKSATPVIVGFYFAPIINATIRVGTKEDKEKIFMALVGEASPEAVIASAISLKGKQDNNKNSVIPRVVMSLQRSGRDENKVILADAPSTLNKSATGLVAGNLASAYQKPAILGRVENGNFVGSLRSLNGSNIEKFKEFCSDSGLVNWAKGHSSAAGISIPEKNIDKFLEYCNDNLPKFEKYFDVDFDISGLKTEQKKKVIEELFSLDEHVGNDFTPVLLYDEITVKPNQIAVIGKNNDTLKIEVDGIVYIRFKQKSFKVPETPKTYRIVGKPNLNEWNGTTTPQLMIEEMEEKELML